MYVHILTRFCICVYIYIRVCKCVYVHYCLYRYCTHHDGCLRKYVCMYILLCVSALMSASTSRV